jgi:hypothetical protein
MKERYIGFQAGKQESKKLLSRARRKQEGNIKQNLKEVEL